MSIADSTGLFPKPLTADIRAEQERQFDEAREAYDRRLRKHLTDDLRVPPEFLELAVRVWWDGKED